MGSSDLEVTSVGQDELLAEIVRRLVDAYDPLRVYLFGSRARGDFGPDSDYDIMVVVPDSASAERRRSRLAYQVLWGLRLRRRHPGLDRERVRAVRATSAAHFRGRSCGKGACCMPRDPANVDEALAWLAKAAQDLRAADVDLAAEPPLVEDAAFHAQQAAEKSLKALLALHDARHPQDP